MGLMSIHQHILKKRKGTVEYVKIRKRYCMIHVHQLKKSYGSIHAVKGIDFTVEKGSFFAFLGPNGAGKSTTINMLCTLLAKDEGDVTIHGHTLGKDDDCIRSSIGVVFQHSMLDGKLTVRQNLHVRGTFYRITPSLIKQKINTLATLLHLDYLDQPYQTLSGGQKRKADIARALIHEPALLFLDEPTTGLDPQTRKDVWEVIGKLQQQNMTIFLTTHYMEEAAQADQIVILHHGTIAAQGTPDFLKKTYAKDNLRLAGNLPKISAFLDQQEMPYVVKNDVIQVSITSLNALSLLNKLSDDLTGFEMIQATLDDVFLDIIGGQ